MILRVLELQSPGSYIALDRGRLTVTNGEQELGTVPVADVGVVLVSNTASSISSSAIAALLERGALIVFCGRNFLPLGILQPLNLHTAGHERVQAQLRTTAPHKKQLWAALVRAKLAHQALLLEAVGQDAELLWRLHRKVRSGDPLNIEAQAARAYWPRLFGNDFRRNSNGDGINALLNYGYTVIRAALARAVVGAGLAPCYSLHHSPKENPLALVDDLIEPFRPLVDALAWQLKNSALDYIAPITKRELCGVLTLDIQTSDGVTTLPQVFHTLCHAYIRAITERAPLTVGNLETTIQSIVTDFQISGSKGAEAVDEE